MAIKALASTPQRRLNVGKRRYLWRHQKDKPGNAAPWSATVVNVTGGCIPVVVTGFFIVSGARPGI
jgi:hypothetical protein